MIVEEFLLISRKFLDEMVTLFYHSSIQKDPCRESISEFFVNHIRCRHSIIDSRASHVERVEDVGILQRVYIVVIDYWLGQDPNIFQDGEIFLVLEISFV